MPLNIDYDPEAKRVRVAVSGAPTVEQFQTALEEITASDQFPPDADTIYDFRDADFSGLSRDALLRFIEVRKQHPERAAARVACVVKGDFAFGMLRMFELNAEDLSQRMMVFKNHADAEEWLCKR